MYKVYFGRNMKKIQIKNARIHNLKNISIDIPKDEYIVFTGVSGSGKSSLVYDVIYRESQRQYLEALGILHETDNDTSFDCIQGLSPAIAVKQSILRESNPRSVVGTKTKMLHYLRMLFVALGKVENDGFEFVEKIQMSHLSFNSPIGMCLHCKGRGYLTYVDTDKLISNQHISIRQICNQLKLSSMAKKELQRFAKFFNCSCDTLYCDLDYTARQAFLYGRKWEEGGFKGIIPPLIWKFGKGRSIGNITARKKCPVCDGFRLGEEGRRLKLDGKHIGQVSDMTLSELEKFLLEIRKNVNDQYSVTDIINKILVLLNGFKELGLKYLSLSREIPSLSGGELQRLFLLNQMNMQITSVIYLFDEPTSGLHELEKRLVMGKIEELYQMGNSIMIVEHDRDVIASARHIIDIGPLAGKYGGEVVYQGDFSGLLSCNESITGRYLSGKNKMPSKTVRDYKTVTDKTTFIQIDNAKLHNLKNIFCKIPLEMIVGIAGVSGSGKSSLISGILIPLLSEYMNNRNKFKSNCTPIIYSEFGNLQVNGLIKGFVQVSQMPIGRNKSSTVITYLKIWDKVREVFANQDLSLKYGFTESDFSFNSKGACDTCGGTGYIEKDLGRLGEISCLCGECNGQRYKEKILEITYKGKNITEILQMNAVEAADFFNQEEPVKYMLDILIQIGMGYIVLGQDTLTLSGGEAQRLKLAKELGRANNENTLYILDEPTVGLSYYDIEKLMETISQLINKGNSVLIIEHDPIVLSFCDWIIELGPQGGDDGGYIIAKGSPKAIKKNPGSKTGPFMHI